MPAIESVGEIDYSITHLSFCLFAEYDSDDDLIDTLELIAGLNLNNSLANKYVDINRDNPQESEIGFGGENVVSPMDSETNSLIVDNSESKDEKIHIHLHADEDNLSQFLTLLDDILKTVKNPRASVLISYIDLPVGFHDLDLPIEAPEEQNEEDLQEDGIKEAVVTGIRIVVDQSDLLMQGYGPEETSIRIAREKEDPVNIDDPVTFIQEELQSPIEAIEEIHP